MESAQIEAEILDEVYDRQNEQNVDLCVKMYSHFKMDGNSDSYYANIQHLLYGVDQY